MKLFVLALAFACVLQFTASNPDDTTTAECIFNAAEELGLDTIQGGVEWMRDLRQTVDDLLNGRRRCLEMTNERLQDACMTAWRAQAIIEGLRLMNDVRQFAGDEAAQQFFDAFLECLGIDPEEVPPAERKRIY